MLFSNKIIAAGSALLLATSPVVFASSQSNAPIQVLDQRQSRIAAEDVDSTAAAAEGSIKSLIDASRMQRRVHGHGNHGHHHGTNTQQFKNSWIVKPGKLSWYGSDQLLNPACGGTVTADDMAAAFNPNAQMGSCGDVVHIHYQGKMVAVTLRDWCASCKHGHLDLTQGAYKAIAGSLDSGIVEGDEVHFRILAN